MHPQFKPLVDSFLTWASARPEVRAAVVIGSQARGEADVFSDLDLVIVTANPQPLIEEDGWLKALGVPIVTFCEPRSTGNGIERRALFEPGLDIDFIPVAVEEWAGWMTGRGPAEVLRILAQGWLVLFDRSGETKASLSAIQRDFSPVPMLGEAAFHELCSDYLYHGVWAAKKLRRGELFVAKICLDGQMKRSLLTLLECHARLREREDVPVRSRGRLFERWSKPSIRERLQASFAQYEEGDLKRALSASLQFFHAIAGEVADAKGYRYVPEAHTRVENLIDDILLGA